MRIVWIFLVWLMIGCSMKNMTPVDVTDSFWEAQSSHNIKNAQKFVTKEQRQNVALDKRIKIVSYRVDESDISANCAVVPTVLRVENPVKLSTKEWIDIPFQTYLIKTNEGWKVEWEKTKRSLYMQSAKLYSKEIGNDIFEKFNDFKEIFKDLVNSLQKSIKK